MFLGAAVSACTARTAPAPHPRLAARPSLLRGLWPDTSSCPAGRSILATPTVPAAPPGRPEQADSRWDHPAGADRQPSSTGGGGRPPAPPHNRCPRRYSSLSWACAPSFGAGSPAAPAQRGRRHLPRHPRDRQTDRQTDAHTRSPHRAPPAARGAAARALGGSPAAARPRGHGGTPRGGPGSGGSAPGGPRGESGSRLLPRWSGSGQALVAGPPPAPRGLWEPAPSVSPSAGTAPATAAAAPTREGGAGGRGGAGPLSSAAAVRGRPAPAGSTREVRAWRGRSSVGLAGGESGAGVGSRGIRGPPELGQDPPPPGALPHPDLNQAYPQLPAAATAVCPAPSASPSKDSSLTSWCGDCFPCPGRC